MKEAKVIGPAAGTTASPRDPIHAPKRANPQRSAQTAGGPTSGSAAAAAERDPYVVDPNAPRFTFHRGRQFAWKAGLLLATTIALIPILISKDVLAAKIYLWALVVVHVAGIFIVAIGVKRHQIAPDTRGLLIRLSAIAILVALLYIASKGLRDDVAGLVFWGSLFTIWALHTFGLALLHIRGRREAALCPFV